MIGVANPTRSWRISWTPIWTPSRPHCTPRIDDALKDRPELPPWRPKVGIAPKLSDAELLTLAVMQVLLGHANETGWLRYARSHLSHLFPYLPGQAGYNKRLRKSARSSRR